MTKGQTWHVLLHSVGCEKYKLPQFHHIYQIALHYTAQAGTAIGNSTPCVWQLRFTLRSSHCALVPTQPLCCINQVQCINHAARGWQAIFMLAE